MTLYRVRYHGLSTTRVMSAQDLKTVGVKIHADELRWDSQNHRSLVIDGMSEELESILRQEGTFSIVEIDAESGKSVKSVIKASRSDDTGSTVIDGTTGQKSVKR